MRAALFRFCFVFVSGIGYGGGDVQESACATSCTPYGFGPGCFLMMEMNDMERKGRISRRQTLRGLGGIGAYGILGVEIACLPEMAVLGWVNPDAHERGCAIPGADSDRFCGLAKKYEIFVCVGLGEKDGRKLYDSAVSNGPWKGRVYGGQSVIADKSGGMAARAMDRDRDVVVVEVEIGEG